MRKAASQVLAAALLVPACGCFTVPISAPQGLALDTTLLGEWECVPIETKSADRAQLQVLRFDEQQYYAEWKEANKIERYRAYPIRIKGVTFLSVGDLTPASQWPWTAISYSTREANSLSLQLPAKRILDMSDDNAAIQDLTAHADRTDTWQPFTRCERPTSHAPHS
jgi:hypothetical protein